MSDIGLRTIEADCGNWGQERVPVKREGPTANETGNSPTAKSGRKIRNTSSKEGVNGSKWGQERRSADVDVDPSTSDKPTFVAEKKNVTQSSITARLMTLAQYVSSKPTLSTTNTSVQSSARRLMVVDQEPSERVATPHECERSQESSERVATPRECKRKRSPTARAARKYRGYVRRLTVVANATRKVVTRQQSKVERDQTASGQNAPIFPGNIDITAVQLADALLSGIIELKLAKTVPSEERLNSLSKDASIFVKMWNELEVRDGVPVRNLPVRHGLPAKRVVVLPEAVRLPNTEACHLEAGHQGRAKTGERVACRCYFPRWRTLVASVCSKYPVCNAFGRGDPPRQGRMVLQEVTEPMGRLVIDLTGLHPPSRRRNIYILTVTDCMTRFLVAVPLRNRFAKTVAAALVKHVFLSLRPMP
jgi:hypothetical protein